MNHEDPWEPTFEDEIHPGVRELDHTADLGIEVEGTTRDAIFRRAAAGMFALMWDEASAGLSPAVARPVEARAPEEHRIGLRATTVDLLLTRWLQELLYLYDARGLVPTRFEFDSLSDTRLEARVGLGRAEAPPTRELKGVTYHDLDVGPVEGRWRARVIFDV